MNDRTEIATLSEQTELANYSVNGLMFDAGRLQSMQVMAKAMSEAAIAVPAHFRGKPGDCLAVVMQAAQWGMNPFAVAQKTHVVNGALGYEAQLVNAVVASSGAINGRFRYEYRGEGNALECRVGAVIRGESDITWNEWVKSSDVTTKNSPLWKTNPRQQMGYLQVKNWARAYTPGAILGIYSDDELANPPERNITAEVTVVSREERPTLPAYDPAAFDANFPKWCDLIAKGKKTADDIITLIGSKAVLSEAHKDAIRDCAQADDIPGPDFIPADEVA